MKAPFTQEQVESLNAYQEAGVFHAFTCGSCGATLVATEQGWKCPDCDYTQDWAHDWMTNNEWRKFDWRNDGDQMKKIE
jgi:hypothetical protein